MPIVASSAAMGLRPSSGDITAKFMIKPSTAVTMTTASRVGTMPQPSADPSHHETMMPTATIEPCAKLATLVTPKISDMPTATKA
jgi:hypothetical protein